MMTFFVLDENPVKSANKMIWLDCESAAFDGARIIVSAIHKLGGETDDLPFERLDGHPLVKWAVVSKENARWLYRNTRAATIKWGKEFKVEGYEEMMKKLNKVASVLDERFQDGQTTLFGNFYITEEMDEVWPTTAMKVNSTIRNSIESNRAYYERTRQHLSWADDDPTLYDSKGDEEE